MSTVTFSQWVRGLTFALLLCVGCGSSGSKHRDVGDEEGGEPPREVRATTDDPSRVRVTWLAPVEPLVTAYKVYRDGDEIAQVPAATLHFEDEGALEAELAAPLDLSASDGTSEDFVALRWKASDREGKATSHVYTVRALRDQQPSPLSEPATGSRPGVLTGYDVSFDNGDTWRSLGLELSYEDTDAPRVEVQFPAPQATPDPSRSLIRLELVGAITAGSAASRTYLVRSRSGKRVSAASRSATGKRSVGRVELLAIQWQRSAGESAADYSDMPNVTGGLWYDAESAATGPRHYRARAASAWAEGVSSPVSARQTLYLSLATGSAHTCGVRASDSKVSCWGHNGFGQAHVEPSQDTFESVVAGAFHSCGLRKQDGKAVCWGDNSDGQAPTEPSADAFTSLSTAGLHTCGLRGDGQVVCWGADDRGQSTAPGGMLFKSVSAGNLHTCGVRQDSKIVCWGSNDEGQAPQDPSQDSFQSVSAGTFHSCGVRTDGRIVCWGSNLPPPEPGQEPLLNVDLSQVPETWRSTRFKSVVAGARNTCALREDGGNLVCWGDSRSLHTPAGPSAEAFASFALGVAHACGVRLDGRLLCWGTGFVGDPAPALPSAAAFKSVASGAFHTCGFEADGKTVCWGMGVDTVPTDAFDSMAAGRNFTCGLRSSDKKAVCWGDNEEGQAPKGPSAEAYASLSAGGGHACGIRAADKSLVCWGNDSMGQLAQAEGAFRAVAAGLQHTCALPDAEDASAECWGDDSEGQATPPSAPLQAIALGAVHSCGIRSADGKVVCWGNNEAGQAPQGPSDDAFKSLTAGYYHTCGIRAVDDRLACWGSYLTEAVPPEPSTEAFKSVSAGMLHTCAVRASDDKLICMGDNSFGAAPRP